MLRLVELALVIGALGALVALVLVDLMGMITNALYFGRLSTRLASLMGLWFAGPPNWMGVSYWCG